jgi:hypothetical protein
MRNFLAAVLSVIAVGVLLIAYGLLSPRMAASDAYPASMARPVFASQVGDVEDLTPRPIAYRVSDTRAVPVYDDRYVDTRSATVAARPVSRVTRSAAPAHVAARPAGRDWTKTAMVIGGTTAAGAGLGAIFGGKKGALIGAAIGGGAGTLYEVKKNQ